MTTTRWLVLTWRLPAASSTPRVAVWRSLHRLGAVTLTPGAAIVPFGEHLLEQLSWIAEDVVQRGGDAYVLPVTELPEADEEMIRKRVRDDRKGEYLRIREDAQALSGASSEREVSALERGLARIVQRDHFASAGRAGAERAVRVARQTRRREG